MTWETIYVDVQRSGGNGPRFYNLTYSMHHVIPHHLLERYSFLQNVSSYGFDVWDSQKNGVPLLYGISSDPSVTTIASKHPDRDLFGGARHTGGHDAYNKAVETVVKLFQDDYDARSMSGDWGSHGSEANWIGAQTAKLEGFVGVLKVELADPGANAKLHSNDVTRNDLKAGVFWGEVAQSFDPKTLQFSTGITDQ